MENTQGFYKLEEDQLIYGPNFVYLPCGTELTKANQTMYTYPIHGWYWFDSLEQAAAFYGVTPEYLQEHTL